MASKSQKFIGVVLSYGGTLLLIAVNIFLTPFLVSSLGEAEYGVYQMMNSFAGYLVLMNFGIGVVMTRYISVYLGKNDKKGEQNFIAMGLIIAAVLMTLILLAATVIYFFIDSIYSHSLSTAQLQKAKVLYIIVAVNMSVTLLAQAFQGIISAYEKFIVINSWSVVRTLVKLILILVLFSFKADSVIIVSVDLFISVLHLLLCAFYSQGVLKARPKLSKFDKAVFSSAGVFAVAIMLQALVNQANARVDTTILGIMIGPESVTTYTVAMQIFTIFTSLSTAIVPVFLPKFSKLVASGERRGEVITAEMIAPSRLQTLVSGAILFCFFLCGRDFIRVWMGEGFELSFIIAVVVMIPNFLVYTNCVIESVLDAMQKRLGRSVALFAVAVCNILLSIVLVGIFGEIGAPIGTAVTTFIGAFIILNIYYKKAAGIKLLMLFKGVFKGILPSLLIAFLIALPVAIFMPVGIWGLIAKGGAFALSLAAMLLLFGLNKDEKRMIKNLFHKK
ncbi:MAG: oligosaccharide flippase family protein [Ruminococcus sp.]